MRQNLKGPMVNGGTDEQERDLRSNVSGKTAIDVDAPLSFVGVFDASRSPHQNDVRLDPGKILSTDQDFGQASQRCEAMVGKKSAAGKVSLISRRPKPLTPGRKLIFVKQRSEKFHFDEKLRANSGQDLTELLSNTTFDNNSLH